MKKFLSLILCLALCSSAMSETKSSSSGRAGSSAKSYSSGSKSYSGRSKSTSPPVKNYSSGSSNKTVKPPTKNYSSGSGKNYGSGKSTTPPVKDNKSISPPPKSYSSGSGKNYSSGTKKNDPPPKTFKSDTDKKYSAGKSTTPPPKTHTSESGESYSNNKSISPPSQNKSTGFSSDLTKSKQQEISKKNYVSTTPKSTYVDSKGKTQSIKQDDKRVQTIRKTITHERYVTYDNRATGFYGSYYHMPMIVYHDPYPSFFWWWLLSQSVDTRAQWAYNHRYDMDQDRYRDLLAKDSQLEARIQQMESQGVVRDSAYTPPELRDQPELMYTKDFVGASYNPQPTSSGLHIVMWIGLLLVVGVCVYFVFFYNFKRN